MIYLCIVGDLKSSLINHRKDFWDYIAGITDHKNLSPRHLVCWAFDVANGMSYLWKNNKMHGDLTYKKNVYINKLATTIDISFVEYDIDILTQNETVKPY